MTKPAFDPADHMIELRGREYLEVRYRVMWLRDRHPDARITTEFVKLTDQEAIVRAVVEIPGGGSADGVYRETPAGAKQAQGKYVEKAQTGAIGRALAFLGFGTANAAELEADDEGLVADTPEPKRPPPEPKPITMAGVSCQKREAVQDGTSIAYYETVKRCPIQGHGGLPWVAKVTPSGQITDWRHKVKGSGDLCTMPEAKAA